VVPDTRGGTTASGPPAGRAGASTGLLGRQPTGVRPELRPHVEQVSATYRQALRTELEAAGIAADDALVHLVFATVDGLVFQQVCLEDPAAARAGVERLRALLRPLAR
jgi:Tetracyclin repressor-like, C-terminal domain